MKVKRLYLFIFCNLLIFSPLLSFAKKTSTRKVQEVNFNEMNLKGTIRNPEGAFLVQKKNLKFLPLHKIQKEMDSKIRESSLYIR
ncbi:MAG TPA: hypothetical protein PLJ21_08585 [Pseudobdellovibrionaceae bacterium]|nr:hypothetical protein [Pseudobdellovibrionaceae bacterium]